MAQNTRFRDISAALAEFDARRVTVDNITFPLLDWRIRVRVNAAPNKVIEFRASKQHTVKAELSSAPQWSLHGQRR